MTLGPHWPWPAWPGPTPIKTKKQKPQTPDDMGEAPF
jgi:hypothetical protein